MNTLNINEAWPLFNLKLSLKDLTLQIADDAALLQLGKVMYEGILNENNQYYLPNMFQTPCESLQEHTQSILQFYWKARAELTVNDWRLNFAVSKKNEDIIGCQSVFAKDFNSTKTASTGSYLAQTWQGQGIGTNMRLMVIEFSFNYLKAQYLTSSYIEGNKQSEAVSKKLGYEDNGVKIEMSTGRNFTDKRIFNRHVLLTRENWLKVRPEELDVMQVEGLERSLEFLQIKNK